MATHTTTLLDSPDSRELARHEAARRFAAFGDPRRWKSFPGWPGEARATMCDWFAEWKATPWAFTEPEPFRATLPKAVARYVDDNAHR